MEARFENRFVRDKNTAREIYGWWFYKRPLFVFVYVYMAIYMLFFALAAVFTPESVGEVIPIVICILICVAAFAFSYFSQVRAMVKRDAEMSGGGELVCTVTVDDTEAVVTALDSRTAIGLENVKFAFATGGYIVLVTKARLMIILKRDSFTLGTSDGFIAFLKEKGIKVKGKKK